jgi:hypothetical protein
MGDRYRQLLRAYPEVIHRLSRPKPLAEIAAFLRESAEIAQYYAISTDAQKVAVTLRDEIFREPQPLTSLDCRLKSRPARALHRTAAAAFAAQAAGTPRAAAAGQPYARGRRAGPGRSSDDDRRWVGRSASQAGSGRVPGDRPCARQLLPEIGRAATHVVRGAHVDPRADARRDHRHRSVDPPSLKTPREALDVTRLDLTAICLTHAHWDHCDVQSLLLFDKRVTVVVPRVHTPTIFNPPMVPMLRMLGVRRHPRGGPVGSHPPR